VSDESPLRVGPLAVPLTTGLAFLLFSSWLSLLSRFSSCFPPYFFPPIRCEEKCRLPRLLGEGSHIGIPSSGRASSEDMSPFGTFAFPVFIEVYSPFAPVERSFCHPLHNGCFIRWLSCYNRPSAPASSPDNSLFGVSLHALSFSDD